MSKAAAKLRHLSNVLKANETWEEEAALLNAVADVLDAADKLPAQRGNFLDTLEKAEQIAEQPND